VGLFLFFIAGLADGVLMPFFALWAQLDAGIPTEYIGLLPREERTRAFGWDPISGSHQAQQP